MVFIAHLQETEISNGEKRKETVKEHSEKTAMIAERYGQPLQISHLVYLAALLHDAGKMNNDFNEYINGSSRFRRGDIDHSYAAARYLEEYSIGANDYE